MKNGDILLEELYNGKCIDKCVVLGETFYIQLFVNFNVFHLQNIQIYHMDRCFWSADVDIIYISEMQKNDELIVYCGFDKHEKKKYSDVIDYDFFDMQIIRENGTFRYRGQTYIVDDVKYVASNPEYMSRAYKDVAAEDLYLYLQKLAKAPAGRHIDAEGQICLWDYNGQFIHQEDGRRITIEVPPDVKKKIHIFGDSRVSGYMLEDKDLFSNMLQHMLNETEEKYEVVNYGIPGREIERMEFQLKKSKLRTNDIVFVMTACHEYRNNSYERQQQFALHLKKIKSICDNKKVKLCYINLPVTVEMINPSDDELTITELYRNYKIREYTFEVIEHFKEYLFMILSSYGIYYHDMATDFNKPHDDLLFINMHHYSPIGNKVIAKVMCRLVNILDAIDYDQNKTQRLYEDAEKDVKRYIVNERKRYGLIRRTRITLGGGKTFGTKQGWFRIWIWIQSILKELQVKKGHKGGVCGAIVMNANPFTLGHRYLVEYASCKVDHLYIFVLEEDRSEILYDDRLHMVYLGVKDLKNVTVTSSGKNVISNDTFPEYFMKKELQNAEIDAYKDIVSFALNVAPLWGITKRFFGEEPLDNVTRQYNEQMKQYLPQFFIDAIEIPRKVDEAGVISATRVRKAMKEKDWETVAKLVPPSTLQYLSNGLNNRIVKKE